MSLLRPGVRVLNQSRYPDAEVTAIVVANMRGDRRRPPLVVVANRNLPTDSREGFTPFDRSQPIQLWVEPPYRYPEAGARSWRMELALSAAHEDWHFHHPDRACPGGICETRAEAYAQREYRRRRLRLIRV